MKKIELINLKELTLTKDFLIAEELTEKGDAVDILAIINNLLYNLLDLLRYEQETEEEKRDYKKIEKIKDEIVVIKSKYIKEM